MRKLSLFLMIVGLLVVGVGCDSNDDDEQSDASLFVGSHAITSVTDVEGDQTAAFAQGFESIVVTFAEGGNFTIAVDAIVDQGDVTVPGTYEVNESANTITLNATTASGTIPLAFEYEFNGNQTNLTAGAQTATALNALFGTTLQAPATITVTRLN